MAAYITNSDGLVALQHRTTNGATVKVGEMTYRFVPQHNVSICMVNPEHVEALLAMQARLCCGKTGPKFLPASQINYNLWLTGDRHGVQ